MATEVSLREIANELDALMDGSTVYLNRQTGEVYSMHDDELYLCEEDADLEDLPEWQVKSVAKNREIMEGDDWLALPGKFDVHEWSIMSDFSHSVEDSGVRDQLLSAIHGTGAFRYFKDTVIRHGIREQWFQFKAAAIEQIVADWLEEHEIKYSREDTSASPE